MIARAAAVAVLLVVLLVIQTAVLPALAVGGFRPEVVLLFVVAVAVVDGAEPGMRVGFAGGLLVDLLLESTAVGVAALSYTVVGHLVGLARPFLAPRSVTAPLLLVFGGSLLAQLGLGLLGRALGDRSVPLRLVLVGAVFVAVAHTVLAPLALWLVRRVAARFPAEASAAPG